MNHEKTHNAKSKNIEIGPQMRCTDMLAGPLNWQLSGLSPRGNTTVTYMAATKEFENTNTTRG